MDKKWTAAKSLFFSRVLTIASLILSVAALFCIPVIAEWYDAVSDNAVKIRTVLTVILYLSDICGIFALWQLFRVLENFAKQRVFVKENAACFRLISWCCFGVALLWLVLMYWRFLAFFVAFIAAFAGLILRVMKNMLEAAVELREENDFTI
ncbi:MAG: DUF2975 domain-containing protein [Oscillospiraceae bacterium]|nr:DUF2975 domain-containing protein [Oscillospiraceae bacterium]